MVVFGGTVVGDIFRRLVLRTIAQQIAKSVEAATSPFQYALWKGPSVSVTILLVDGIGVFDHVSRNSMLRGLMEIDVANGALPFVRQFHGQPSVCFWDGEMGPGEGAIKSTAWRNARIGHCLWSNLESCLLLALLQREPKSHQDVGNFDKS